MGRPLKMDLTGQRYGRLLVLNRSNNQGKKVAWFCQCDCGRIVRVQTYNLIFGLTTSCGCRRRENCRIVGRLGKSKRNPY